MVMSKELNGYVEHLHTKININDKTDIRILTSKPINKPNDELLVDLRKYTLYGNTYDNIKRPTKRGIKFKLFNIPKIIKGLVSILYYNNMLDVANKVEIDTIMSCCEHNLQVYR